MVTALLAGPVLWWLTSPRRLARRAVRRWERIGAEVVQLMSVSVPRGTVPPAVMSGRICAAGSTSARDVCAAPGALAAFHNVSAHLSPTRAPLGVVGPSFSPIGDSTAPRRSIRVA